MKKKDTVYLVILLVMGLVAAVLLLPGLTKGSSKKTATVEVVPVITSDYDAQAKATIDDPSKVINYTPPKDLTNLGKSHPFDPL